jgi:hypothetical protein
MKRRLSRPDYCQSAEFGATTMLRTMRAFGDLFIVVEQPLKRVRRICGNSPGHHHQWILLNKPLQQSLP